MPAVSILGVRKSAKRDLDATINDIIYFSKPMVSRHGFLTANKQAPYVVVLLDTTNGPVVLDVPSARAGFAAEHKRDLLCVTRVKPDWRIAIRIGHCR